MSQEIEKLVDDVMAASEEERLRLCAEGTLEDNLISQLGWYKAFLNVIEEEPLDEPEVQAALVARLREITAPVDNIKTMIEDFIRTTS